MTPILFSLEGGHPLSVSLSEGLKAQEIVVNWHRFPDGESYIRIESDVTGRDCLILASLVDPDTKFLPLCFMATTLREMGARSVGLVAPYLCYMRQDKRFLEGEAITSRVFAALISAQVDWLVTVDPHLHRYHDLDEIYDIPNQVVHGAPLLAEWLGERDETMLLVGPDAESEQWVAAIGDQSGSEYVVGEKHRRGDRDVEVILPDISGHSEKTAVIVDDVISSGQTLLKCIEAVRAQGISRVYCAAIHGIFADNSDEMLMKSGLDRLITCNSIDHPSNAVDLTRPLLESVQLLLG
jgi:ribose-phosphate pyrophosphokinase